jgi:hypothetical protein
MFKLFDVLFGCSHNRYTFPMSAKSGSPAAATTGTYVVCLDCGREFPYDWREMKIVSGAEAAPVLPESPEPINRAA